MFNKKVLNIANEATFYNNILQKSEQFAVCSFLNSNDVAADKYSKYNWIIALDSICILDSKQTNTDNYIIDTQVFMDNNAGDWIFTALSYDYKNGIEKLFSNNSDKLEFSDFFYYVPKYVITNIDNEITLHYHSSLTIKDLLKFETIISSDVTDTSDKFHNIGYFKNRISKKKYLETIDSIRKDIKHGDIYEMNFCQEFYVEGAIIAKPWLIYKKMCKLSPAPFSAYYRINDKYIISASPERYMQKNSNKIITQPIKGTARRKSNAIEDKKAIADLKTSTKEIAENIMIVDLVRNDLSRIPNSKKTKVEELCEIYSFKHVHQMISTISAEISADTNITDIFKATFPMGSMTGAPKYSSMELIEKYEDIKRGIFSGSVGYTEPNGDFDFNVIIRTLLFNSSNKYLSLSTGGAITYLCNAEDEYQESLLKAEAVFKLF